MLEAVVCDILASMKVDGGEVGTALCEVIKAVVRDKVATGQIDGDKIRTALG